MFNTIAKQRDNLSVKSYNDPLDKTIIVMNEL